MGASHIGLEVAGAPRNFVVFRPRKAHIIMEFKLPPQGEEPKAMLEDVGLGTLAYDSQFGYYRIRVDPTPNDKQRAALLKLIQQARERLGK